MARVSRFFITLVCTLLLSSSLRCMAQRSEAVDLEWQLPEQWGDTRKSSIRFRAQQNNHHSKEGRSFNGEVAVAGRTGQQFIVCAGEMSSDDFTQTSVVAEISHLHTLTLTKNAGVLSINNGGACPEWLTSHYPYDMAQQILSTEPFIATRKKEPQNHHNEQRQLSALPSNPFEPKESALITLTGSGSGFDDQEDFKRPPFMPMPDKAMANLILLPTLNLPDNWRDYLSFVGLYHWLTDQPEEQVGLTLLVHFDGQPPITLRISQAEYPEMAEHLLSARQLLRWLAPKLNGRETFTQQLLNVVDSINDNSPLWDEDTLNSIQQQLMIVLEQPDMEFSLEFETHLLFDTLSGWSQSASPEAGIIQWPKGKTGNQPEQLPADQGAGQSSGASGKEQGAGRPSGQAGDGNDGDNSEGSRQPGPPPGLQAASNVEEYKDYFVIVVNGVEFRIKKEQMPPLGRGQEKASSIKAYKPENPAVSLPLTEVEADTGIPEQYRLAKYHCRPLEYLLTYGVATTKNALQDYYPVNLISAQGGHLVAEVDHRNYPVDETCQMCSEPLIAQHSLTHCTKSHQHVFHTGCLARWLQEKHWGFERDTRTTYTTCPVCNKNQTRKLRDLLSEEGLISELHRAAKAGDSEIIKALLETSVNVEARDEQGNTALHLAAQAGHSDIVLMLTDYGVDFEVENHAGQLPIATAAENPDIIDIIKQANQNPGIFLTVLTGREEAFKGLAEFRKYAGYNPPF